MLQYLTQTMFSITMKKKLIKLTLQQNIFNYYSKIYPIITAKYTQSIHYCSNDKHTFYVRK